MKSEIESLLADDKVLLVVFTKADGSERAMLCTLNTEYIEKPSFSRSSGPEGIKTVWDIEKSAWRSFRWDSVISYKEQEVNESV